MKIGIVFGTFAPMHLGHIDVINTAKKETDRVIIACCGHDGDRGYPVFPLEKRYELAVTQFNNDEKVSVILFPDTKPEIKKNWEQQQIWNYWVERMLLVLFQNDLIHARDELVFYTSEEEYVGLLQNSPQKIAVRGCHREKAISATMIREDFEKYKDMMAPAFKEYLSKEIK